MNHGGDILLNRWFWNISAVSLTINIDWTKDVTSIYFKCRYFFFIALYQHTVMTQISSWRIELGGLPLSQPNSASAGAAYLGHTLAPQGRRNCLRQFWAACKGTKMVYGTFTTLQGWCKLLVSALGCPWTMPWKSLLVASAEQFIFQKTSETDFENLKWSPQGLKDSFGPFSKKYPCWVELGP